MKNNPHYYSIGLLCLSILITGGGYYFVAKSLWSKAASVATYKNELISGDQKKQFAQIMLKSFESSQDEISLLQSFFVKKQGEVDFIEFIEQTAQKEGLEVKMEVSIDSPKNMASYGMEYLVLNLQVRGPWSRVWNFSRMLEVLPYSTNLKSFALIQEEGEIGSVASRVWKGIYTVKVLKKK